MPPVDARPITRPWWTWPLWVAAAAAGLKFGFDFGISISGVGMGVAMAVMTALFGALLVDGLVIAVLRLVRRRDSRAELP